jgi:hypothetical protein
VDSRVEIFAKGHQYLTLVCDLDHATVEYLAEDRKQASLEGYQEDGLRLPEPRTLQGAIYFH